MKRYLIIPASALLFTTGCGITESTETPTEATTEQNAEEVAVQSSQQDATQSTEEQEEVLKGKVADYVIYVNTAKYSKIKGLAYPESTFYNMWESSFDGAIFEPLPVTQTSVLNIEVLKIEGGVAYVYTEERQISDEGADLNMQYVNYYELKKYEGEWRIYNIAPDFEGVVNKDIETLKTHLQEQADFLEESHSNS